MHSGSNGQSGSLHESVSWRPVVFEGSKFRTFRLGQVSKDRWEYRPTWGSYLLALLPIVASFVFIYVTANKYRSGSGLNPVGVLLALGLLIYGLVLLRNTCAKYILDFQSNIYWENPFGFGRKQGPEYAKGEVLDLNRVVALQILSEYWETDSNEGDVHETHASYELNLVLNGSRRNIVDHGDLKAVVKEGKALAQKMGVPLLLQDPKWQRL